MHRWAIIGWTVLSVVGCGGSDTSTPAPPGADAADSASTDSAGSDTAGTDTAGTDVGATDADAGTDLGGDTGCAGAASTEACITCCRQPEAPNYGGFELLASDTCGACTECAGLSPCGTNVTPPAGKACVSCLQKKLSTGGLPSGCAGDTKCKSFAACLETCPLR